MKNLQIIIILLFYPTLFMAQPIEIEVSEMQIDIEIGMDTCLIYEEEKLIRISFSHFQRDSFLLLEESELNELHTDFVALDTLTRKGFGKEIRPCLRNPPARIIFELQLKLIHRDFTSVIATGIYDEATQSALHQYQRQQIPKLPVGCLNLETLDHLEIKYN